jgi:hypothetical protein
MKITSGYMDVIYGEIVDWKCMMIIVEKIFLKEKLSKFSRFLS